MFRPKNVYVQVNAKEFTALHDLTLSSFGISIQIKPLFGLSTMSQLETDQVMTSVSITLSRVVTYPKAN
jgi:hypothetical protein